MAINQFNQPYQAPQLIYSQPQQNVPNVPGYLAQPQMIQPIPQPQNSIIFIKGGEQGAKSYYVQPNTTVILWDDEENVIYLKSADGSGMPTMKILDYTVRGGDNNNSSNSVSDDISNQLSSLSERVKELENKIDILNNKRNNYNNNRKGE